jgi:hypothetical protein
MTPHDNTRLYYKSDHFITHHLTLQSKVQDNTGCFTTCGHTAGGDFLGLSDQKVPINMCPILDGYGVRAFFNSRTRPRVNRVLRNQLAGDVLKLVAYRLRCKHYFCHLTHPPGYRQSTSRTSTLGRYLLIGGLGGVGGHSPGQCILNDSAITTRSKTLITYITVTGPPAPNGQNSMAIVS